jgi:4-diphosphocytidyl-2-C-methyl-D-erythritol kinase
MAVTGTDFFPAFAKINLSLEVLGRRKDGYHDLASVMQTISLHDTLRLLPAADETVECVCDIEALATAENLATRAVYLARTVPRPDDAVIPGMRIELQKVIPFQAGLGGGSSDAATVLAILNRRWRLGQSVQHLELASAALGADVPFFMRGGTASVSGIGERVHALPDIQPLWILLAMPPVRVSTPLIFKALTAADFTGGEHTAALEEQIRRGGALDSRYMVNCLEARAIELFPEIAQARDALLRAGAPFVRMSGSGATLFAPFRELADAAPVAAYAREQGLTVHLTHTVGRDEVARSRLEYGA